MISVRFQPNNAIRKAIIKVSRLSVSFFYASSSSGADFVRVICEYQVNELAIGSVSDV